MARNKKVEIKELNYGICHISMLTIRSKPLHNSEIVTQMLFGETCEVLEKKNKNWHKVKTRICQTVGWVSTSQLTYIDEKFYIKASQQISLSIEVSYPAFTDDNAIYIVLGSSLPSYDGIRCVMPFSNYIFNGQALADGTTDISSELFTKIARKFLYSPEMSGGRSPFGIDNVSFVHQVFRFFNIDVTREIRSQFRMGEIVDFAQMAQVGDIAFFQDINENINHVGIIIGEKLIIHVNGYVRIDRFDHNGIFNKELKKYTHSLRIIKRISKLNELFAKANSKSS